MPAKPSMANRPFQFSADPVKPNFQPMPFSDLLAYLLSYLIFCYFPSHVMVLLHSAT
jgi:hypothetical protein